MIHPAFEPSLSANYTNLKMAITFRLLALFVHCGAKEGLCEPCTGNTKHGVPVAATIPARRRRQGGERTAAQRSLYQAGRCRPAAKLRRVLALIPDHSVDRVHEFLPLHCAGKSASTQSTPPPCAVLPFSGNPATAPIAKMGTSDQGND